jgi:hypothetical protein
MYVLANAMRQKRIHQGHHNHDLRTLDGYAPLGS